MIGDRLYITPKSKQNARLILQQRTPTTRVILIFGGSGTQKSETADCLQELLSSEGKQSLMLSLDDFYYTIPSVRNKNRKKLGISSVGISEIDWGNLETICNKFLKRKLITIRRTHKYADLVEQVNLDTSEIDTLIIEGLYAGYLKRSIKSAYGVYLMGNEKNTLEFRKMRAKENENDPFRKKVVTKEYRVVCQLKQYADVVIPE